MQSTSVLHITRKAEIAPRSSIAVGLKLLHSLPVLIHKLEFMINPQPTSELHQPCLFVTIFCNIEITACFYKQCINHIPELGPDPANF